jgi:hypothetical protein
LYPLIRVRVIITNANHYLSTTYKILSNILLPSLTPYVNVIIGVINMGYDVTDQLLIRYAAFDKHWRKNMNTMGKYTENYRLLESQQFGYDVCSAWACYFDASQWAQYHCLTHSTPYKNLKNM